MAIFLITILIVIIFILAGICAKRGAQISSLKNQIKFLEFQLKDLTAKENLEQGLLKKKEIKERD